MNKHRLKYRKIVNELIKKSFPSLKSKRILIFEYSSLIWWANAFTLIHPEGYFIFVNKRIRKFDRKSLVGLLAHELCHFKTEKEDITSTWQAISHYLKVNLSWIFNTSLSKKIERDTDIMTIKKGYGKELLAFNLKIMRELSKRGLQKRYSRGYLSPEGIKKYL